jgi:serine/threonine protein kinase
VSFQYDAAARDFCASKGFAFVAPVGEGAFKETYCVTRPTGEQLALKIYRPGSPAERTTREVEAMVRCTHPNIGQLVDISSYPFSGTQYLIMLEEYLAGGTLSDRLVGGRLLSNADIVALGAHLIDAISHVAGHRLVHRDLKPDNIMFRDGGMSPVIVDFGLVRDLNKLSITVTWAMRGPGTPLFAPPEQLLNEKAMIDWRADQFSLAVLLSFAALGIHPYAADPSDDWAVIVDRVANRAGPSQEFVTAARVARLDTLTRMSAPYPIQRFRLPQQLSTAWPRGT